MQNRRFGRLGWDASEVGYGMWGMAGWTGSDDEQSLAALERAVALGCTFFDTAWAYGDGRSERLLGEILRRHRDKRLSAATKIPPKNRRWPGRAEDRIDEVFPADHIREYTEKSLTNLGIDTIDLQQFHVWSDAWALDDLWQRAVSDLKTEGLVRGFGISVNRWQPANVLRALDTDLVDSVQVVYNIFDQSPEDMLLPACQERDIAVIARVPFDEGSLTGTLTRDTRWPEQDFRSHYFFPEHLEAAVDRVERLKPVVPRGMTLPELALRFILQQPAISTVIPGMRKPAHVNENMRISDSQPLSDDLMSELRRHRWERTFDLA
ncbi:MAG: aldo/keto reductase [Acidobacteria bacterium]|nr:aldo/keto reductase [Acidobacteriota bacterium]